MLPLVFSEGHRSLHHVNADIWSGVGSVLLVQGARVLVPAQTVNINHMLMEYGAKCCVGHILHCVGVVWVHTMCKYWNMKLCIIHRFVIGYWF